MRDRHRYAARVKVRQPRRGQRRAARAPAATALSGAEGSGGNARNEPGSFITISDIFRADMLFFLSSRRVVSLCGAHECVRSGRMYEKKKIDGAAFRVGQTGL